MILLSCVRPGSKGVFGQIVRQQSVPDCTLRAGLRLAEVCACTPSLSCVPYCIPQCLRIAACQICPWPCLTGRHMKGSSDVSGSILRDVAVAAKLGAQLLKLHIVLGELAAEWLKKVEEVLRLDAAGPQQLQSAALVAHH